MRIDGWQKRLRAVIADARTREFSWGTHDCCTFAAAAVEAVTGVDHRDAIRQRYPVGDARAALAKIRTGGGLEQMVSEVLGQSVPYGWCGAGDVVLAVNLERELLAVHDGYQLLVPSDEGFVVLPVTSGVVGWRIG